MFGLYGFIYKRGKEGDSSLLVVNKINSAEEQNRENDYRDSI